VTHHACKNKDAAPAIASAIRERIRSLEEELAHWRRMLGDCEGTPEAPPPPSTPPERRAKLAG
jgi:hypothetical protein